MEVHEANFGAVNNHKVVLEEATPKDREQRQNHSHRASGEKKSTKETKPDCRNGAQAKNLDDDE